MAAPTFSTNGTANGHTTGASSHDAALDTLYAWVAPPTPAPQPLPEAAFSLTLRGTMAGQDAMLTVRGMTPEAFRRNVEAITGLLDQVPTKAAPAPVAEPGQDYCFTHQVGMQWREGKQGRKGWFSHRVEDGSWCKGR